MKRFPLLLAALLGVAVSVPAQNHRSGRYRQAQVVVTEPAARAPAQRQVLRHGRPASVTRSARRVGVQRGVLRDGCSVGYRGYGRWETRCERVLVPGYWHRQHVPAVFGWVYDSCGRRQWGVVRAACFERVWVPARYETQRRRVWVRY